MKTAQEEFDENPEGWLKYAETIARAYLKPPMPDDLTHDAAVDGLLKALAKHDPEYGASFKTFLAITVRSKCIDALRPFLARSAKRKRAMEERKYLYEPEMMTHPDEAKEELQKVLAGVDKRVVDVWLKCATGMSVGDAIQSDGAYKGSYFWKRQREELEQLRRTTNKRIMIKTVSFK